MIYVLLSADILNGVQFVKNNIYILIILTIFGCFQSFCMEEQRGVKRKIENIEGIERTKEVSSLLEFATRPLAAQAIKIYDEQGLGKMQMYMMDLAGKTSRSDSRVINADIADRTIKQVYSVMVKTFNRGDNLIEQSGQS